MRNSRGFTLVEVLIGMVIGLLVIIVIGQVMSFAEGQKRSTTSGSDSQVNGAIATHTIERDVRNAGYGTMPAGIGCEIKASYNGAAKSVFNFAAVVTDGANSAPDTITIVTSETNSDCSTSLNVPRNITKDHPETSANFCVDNALGMCDGDLVIAFSTDPSKWCTMFQVTKDPNPGGGGGGGANSCADPKKVLHAPGQSPWNPAGGQNIQPSGGYQVYSPPSQPYRTGLINIGNIIQRTYAVNATSSLQVTEENWRNATSTTRELFPQIIDLQAQYGKDTNSDGSVDVWNAISPAAANKTEWAQIIALRFAIVTRSPLYEKDEVTPTAPSWTGGAIKLDGNADWKHYRYRVFETVAPLRNVIWRQS